MPKKYMRTAPTVELPDQGASPEDVYTEIRALVQRRLDRLHVEEQQLADMLTQIGTVSPLEPEGNGAAPPRRKVKAKAAAPKKSHMSAAARKVVSERMKAYWASKRKADKKAEKAAEK